jgi:hypothetical protein
MFDHFCDMEMDFGRGFMLVLVEVVTNVGRFSIFYVWNFQLVLISLNWWYKFIMFDHFCDMEMDFGRGFMLVLVEVVTNVGRFSIFWKTFMVRSILLLFLERIASQDFEFN